MSIIIEKKQVFLLLLSFTMLLLLFNCKSPKDLLKKGDYAKVLNSLDSKAKKKKLSTQEKDLFVKAFNGYLNQSKKDLELYLQSQKVQDWKKGVENLNKISTKQEEYLAYPQILDKDVTAIDIDRWFVAFSEKLYAHHWSNYLDITAEYKKTGERLLMRDAYKELYYLSDYDNGNVDLDSLSGICLELGHRSFYVELRNNSLEHFNYSYFENDINLHDDDWNSYDFRNRNVDFELILSLESVYPNEFIRNDGVRIYRERIIVGYNNVADSTGTRQEPIYEEVEAQVREIEYVYNVEVIASIEMYSREEGRNRYSRRISEREEEIETRAYLLSGDNRAVPPGLALDSGGQFNNYNWDYIIRDALRELAREVTFVVERI